MARRRPFAVILYKTSGAKRFYGFATRADAEAFRTRHIGRIAHAGTTADVGSVSPVIHLGGRRA